jgi:peptide deformylase
MSLREVLVFPDPRLRLVAKPIEKFTPETQALLKDMGETMYAERGIGLAAIQINVQLRAIVIDVSNNKESLFHMANPEIFYTEGTQEVKAGCLSVPEIYETVPYPAKLNVKYWDLNGETKELEAEGLLAACVQHEVDHLNGKLFIDYLSPLKRSRIEKKLKKMKNIRL